MTKYFTFLLEERKKINDLSDNIICSAVQIKSEIDQFRLNVKCKYRSFVCYK